MKVNQVHQFLNDIKPSIIGDSLLINEDLSNIVDIGEAFLSKDNQEITTYNLMNQIGKTLIENRTYSVTNPKLLRDAFEYGSILQKIKIDMPEATENPTYELVDGTSYDQDVFNGPKTSSKFYNLKSTFEFDQSIAKEQLKVNFRNASDLASFVTGIENSVSNVMSLYMDSLITRTINNLISKTIIADFPESNFDKKSGIKAINLLHLYNSKLPDDSVPLNQNNMLSEPEFLKFSCNVIGNYRTRFKRFSKLFNLEGRTVFSPDDKQELLLLSDFSKAIETNLLSNLYNPKNVSIGEYTSIPYWQGSGTSYDFSTTSSIKVKNGDNEFNIDGILCTLYDIESCGVLNAKPKITTHYNAKGDFFNNFHKFEASYFNDLGENFIVFFAK